MTRQEAHQTYFLGHAWLMLAMAILAFGGQFWIGCVCTGFGVLNLAVGVLIRTEG